MLISKLMTTKVLTVTPGDSLAHANAMMEHNRFRTLPVVRDGKLVGILTDRDVKKHWGHLDVAKVDAAMTSDPLTIGPDSSAEDAARMMLEHKISGFPVLENGKLVGVVTTSDLLKAFLRLIQGVLEIMHG
jgi:acetoin utilization protein AcuB